MTFWRNLFGATFISLTLALHCSSASASGLKTWEKRFSIPDGYLKGIAYANNLFIAVGNLGTILTSPDGKEWQSRFGTTNVVFNSAAYGNGRFVVVGQYWGAVSTNGVDWSLTDHFVPPPDTLPGCDREFLDVAFGNSIFVATGYDLCAGPGFVGISSDGIHWTRAYNDVVREVHLYHLEGGVIFGAGRFLASGGRFSFRGGRGRATVITSLNGTDWFFSNYQTYFSGIVECAAFGNGLWVVSGTSDEGGLGIKNYVAVSSTTSNWVVSTENAFTEMAFSNGLFIAADRSRQAIFSSVDGLNWTMETEHIAGDKSLFLQITDIASDGKTAVVVCGSNIYQSGPLPSILRFGEETRITSETYEVSVLGSENRVVALEGSRDLKQWAPLTVLTNYHGTVSLTNRLEGTDQIFLRAKLLEQLPE